MMCNCRTILTTAVAIQGTNLVLTLPAGTYENCHNYVIRIAQPIPATATNLMGVAIKIGTAATLYQVIRTCGHKLYANQVKARRNYRLLVAADTQQFVVTGGFICGSNCGAAASIPVPVTTASVQAASESKKKEV